MSLSIFAYPYKLLESLVIRFRNFVTSASKRLTYPFCAIHHQPCKFTESTTDHVAH